MISSDPISSQETISFEEISSIDSLPIKEKTTFQVAYETLSQLTEVMCSYENRKLIGGITTLISLSMANRFISPLLLGKVIESFGQGSQVASIGGIALSRSTLLVSFVASSALSPLLGSLQSHLSNHLELNVMQQMMQKSVEHFLHRSLDFHTQTSVTEMFNLVQKAFSLQGVGVALITQIFPTLIESAIAATILSYQFGPIVGGATIALIGAYIVYSFWMTQKIVNSREEVMLAWNSAFQTMGDILSRYKLTRDCNQQEKEFKTLETAFQDLKKIDLKSSQLATSSDVGYNLLSYTHMLCTALYITRNSETKNIVSLIGYLTSFASLIPNFAHGMTRFFSLYPDLKFFFSKLSQPSEILDPYPNTPLQIEKAPKISFEGVQFRYPTKEGYLFQDLSFEIPAGAKVALVSRSGAGKTSAFQLLYRYYDPSSGIIQINSQDISKVSLESLQKQICLLGQQAILFQGSVRDNILYGARDSKTISDADLEDLAESLGFGDFFGSLQNGLDTNVGEGGKALSGGQQQKVALLRSLLKPTKIRLLDEATASLDNISSSKMLNALLDRNLDVTTLMITHKLTEARIAEIILFLDEGKIIAQGTHEELLNTCPPYLELWQSQINESPLPSSFS